VGFGIMVLSILLPEAVMAQPSAQQRQAAAEAYDRGSAAYLAGDFADAAHWFETAHRLAPSSAALVQAVRTRIRAGDEVRAATLALRLQAQYGEDARASQTAASVLEDTGDLVRVEVECAGCALDLDGTLLDWPSFFIRGDSEHRIVAHFPTGDVERVLMGEAGGRLELTIEPPPLDGDAEGLPDSDSANVDSSGGDTNDGSGISPLFVAGAGALTAISLGITIWSGLNTLSGVDDYESSPTEEGLAAGQRKERRTNVLIATTAGLAALTAALALFTDWNAELWPSTHATATAGPDGVVLGVEGRF